MTVYIVTKPLTQSPWTGVKWMGICGMKYLQGEQRPLLAARFALVRCTHMWTVLKPWKVVFYLLNLLVGMCGGKAGCPLVRFDTCLMTPRGNRCTFQPCKFSHVCSKCWGGHPATHCSSFKKDRPYTMKKDRHRCQ